MTADRWDRGRSYTFRVATEETIGGASPPPPADTDPAQRPLISWRWPLGRLFHLALVPPALGLLWSHSFPGLIIFPWVGSVAFLFLGAVVWGVRLLTFAFAKYRGRAEGRARWLFVAPAVGVLVVTLLVADVSLRARWSVSRSDFEAVVDEVMKDEDYRSIENQRLGFYDITSIYRQGEAIIFDERNGDFFDDAGFAYLPNGPFPELENGGFEAPQFRHLGGPWYAWTASW